MITPIWVLHQMVFGVVLVVEVKCPYTVRDQGINAYAKMQLAPLFAEENGNFGIKEDHQYYYQMQMQLFVLNVDLAHFVVWTKNEITIIVVIKNISFWEIEYPKTKIFFERVILPEIMGTFYIR